MKMSQTFPMTLILFQTKIKQLNVIKPPPHVTWGGGFILFLF